MRFYSCVGHRRTNRQYRRKVQVNPRQQGRDVYKRQFLRSEKLQNHVKFLYEKGSIYLTFNNNLLYHGCIPMNSDGTFTEVTLFGETVSGKSLMDKAEQLARDGYFAKNGSEEKEYGKDFLWFLWCGC